MDRVKVVATICNASVKTIIFCRTKRGADRLVEQLEKEGVRAAAIPAIDGNASSILVATKY